MKAKLLFALIFVMIVALGCKKDDPSDFDDDPTPPETSITFTCKDSLGIPDVLVGISFQQVDCTTGVFLRQGVTDALGKIKFSGLASGLYYFCCARTTNNGVVRRSGTVDVLQDEEERQNVFF
jgi:hypothetical protein